MTLSTSGPYTVQNIFNALLVNREEAAFTSTLRVGTSTSDDLVNHYGRGMAILVNITTGSASGTIGTIDIQAKIASGTYMNIYSFTPSDFTTGTSAFLVYPGAASPGGWTVAPVQGIVPRNYRLRVQPVFATATIGYDITVSYII